MLRAEYLKAQEEVASHTSALVQAAQKCASGDVRGARVRVEKALETLRRVEEMYCNDAGYLNDPGDDEINNNQPGRPR